MKNKLLLMLLMLAGFSVARAETKQIPASFSANSSTYLPTYSYFKYGVSEQIYTPGELNNFSGKIYSLGFYNEGEERTRTIDLYLQTTDKSFFDSDTDWITVTEGGQAVCVFSGDVTFAKGTWTTINFTNEFNYSSSKGNLVVIVNDRTGNDPSGLRCLTFNTGNYTMAIATRRDSESFDLATLVEAGISGNRYNNKNILLINGSQKVGSLPESTSLPTNSYYKYTHSMQLYTKEELGLNASDTIKSIAFFNNGAEMTRMIDLHLMRTNKSEYENGTDIILYDVNTKMFSGSVTFVSNDWTTIVLDEPYVYNGESNIVVCTEDKTGSYTGQTPFLAFDAPKQAITYSSDLSSLLDLSGGTLLDVKNAIRLEYSPYIDPDVIGSQGGTATSSYLPTHTYYHYSLTQQIYTAAELGEAGDIISIDFFSTADERTRNLDIYMVSTNKESFANNADWVPVTESDLVFSGNVTFEQNEWTTITLDEPFEYDGTQNVVLVVDDNTGSDVNNPAFRVFNAPGQAIRVYADGTNFDPSNPPTEGFTSLSVMDVKNQIRIDKGEAPAVAKPKGVQVTYTGGTEATVSWTSKESVFDIDVNGTITQNVGNPCTLTGLDYATIYTIKVRAKKGSEVSGWSVPVSFNTDLSDDMCQIKLELTDSYGDGWNGAAIEIWDDESGIEIGTYSLTPEAGTETQTFYVDVPNNRTIVFQWVAGGYPAECSYAAYDVNGEEIISGSGGFETFAYDVDCKVTLWRTPTNFTASEIGPRSVKLSWTENSLTPATSWEIEYVGEDDENTTFIVVDSNPYVLTGLTPETQYVAHIRPYTDEATKWSEVIYFTTNIPNPAPADLAVEPAPNSATVSWTGFGDSYDLVYAEGYFANGTEWLSHDDGVHATNIGSDSSFERTWGVMFPGNMVGGNVLTKVSIYETSEYNTEDITIEILQGGGDLGPSTLLYTETITPEAADAFHEVTLATPVDITPGENLWIMLTETGKYVMAAYSQPSANPNSNWVWNDGEWQHIGDLNSKLSDYGWMIRAEVTSNVDLSEVTWTALSNASSPCTLTGLKPETGYTVMVQAIYDDGVSDWTTTRFTTLEANPVPFDVAVKPSATSATILWTGYSDSYGVSYRTAQKEAGYNAYFFEDFEGITTDGELPEGWTMIDADGDGFNWYSHINTGTGNHTCHSGDICVCSQSYDKDGKNVLYPDNWLITPRVDLKGVVKAWLIGQDANYAEEHFAFYVSTTGTNVSDFTKISEEFVASGVYEEYTADLSAYEGMKGYVAIRHYNVSDMFILNVDDFGLYEKISDPRPAGEWQTIETTGTSVRLTGLTPNTKYDYIIHGYKSGEFTASTYIESFTTLSSSEPDDLILYADGNNNATIIEHEGETVNAIIVGRTFRKDGTWQTICLPFDIEVEGSVLEGAYVRMAESAFTLNPYYIFNCLTPVTMLQAGVPYIIRWDSGEDIVNPVFEGVTINSTLTPSILDQGKVMFTGTYDYISFEGPGGNFYVVNETPVLCSCGTGTEIQAFDGFFQILDSSIINTAAAIGLNTGLDDLMTGIGSPSGTESETIYNIAGQRLAKKQRGINIINHKKAVVK